MRMHSHMHTYMHKCIMAYVHIYRHKQTIYLWLNTASLACYKPLRDTALQSSLAAKQRPEHWQKQLAGSIGFDRIR